MEYTKVDPIQGIKQQPDFQRLLDSLRKETAIANELTTKVSYLSNLLKQIERAETPEDGRLSKEPQGVIDHFWEQVWSLRRSNEEMEVVANHLQSIIGN